MRTKIKKLEKEKINFYTIKQSFQLFLRFNKYVLHYWKFVAIILILGNSAVILSLVNPYIGKNVLDKGILGKDIRAFLTFTIFGIGIYLMNLVIGNIHRYYKNYIIRKVKIDLTKDLLKKIRRYSLRFFQTRSTGGHMFRLSHDIAGATHIINDTLPNLIMTVFKLIAITTIIIFINWKILILIMVYQLLILFQINLFIKKVQELMRANLEKSENIFKRLNEVFSHIYVVKVFGTIGRETRMYLHDLIERMRLEIRGTKLKIVSGFLGSISNKLFFGIIGFYGSILVIRGELTLGSLGAVMVYITQGIGAYTSLLNFGRQMVLNRILLERVTALFDVAIEIKEKKNAKNIIFSKGKIEFRNVIFGYKKDKHVLDNMNFYILPNTHIAIVGHSGCGKTTILNLILRLYEVDGGCVLLDDYDLRDLKFKSIYSQIGMSPQEPFLWNYSIKNNITYGKTDATLEEIRRASEIAQIYDFIESLPDGFNTLIGEDACWISQGQKQRVSIARTIIKRPKILMIDEAMSSLDSETEERIVDNIRREFKDSTVIVVSHRLSTVKKMDLIYFLEEPNRMDIGTHSNLLRNQRYRELFASQIEEGILVNEPKA